MKKTCSFLAFRRDTRSQNLRAANDGQYCKQYLKPAVHHFAKSPFDRRTSSLRSPNIEALWNGPVGFLSGHTDRIVTFRLPHCVQTNRRWRGMCIIVMSSVNRSSSNVKTFRVRADQAGGAIDAQRRDSVPAIVGDGR